MYDIWANLYQINALKCAMNYLNQSIDPNNRIAGAPYDAAGNVWTNVITYDAEGRMTNTDAFVAYLYDGDGQRVKKDHQTGTTYDKLYWHGTSGEALVETDHAGNNPTEFIFFNGQRIARREPNGTVYYFFSDHLGSSRIVTNAGGAVVEDSDFYPFGQERPVADALNNNYKFTGQEFDPEITQYYFLARHYDALRGRFFQPDEFTGGPVDAFSSNDPLPPGPLPYADITNPQSLNKYTYVYNNPLTYLDPNGHSVWTKIGKVILTGGDIVGTAAAVKEDVEVLVDSNAPLMDRVEAFGRAGSEFLPLSVSDAEDLGTIAGEVIADVENAIESRNAQQGTVGAAAVGGTYLLKDPTTGEVMRTGQTKDLERRKPEHARGEETKGLKFQVDKKSDSRAARLGREQMLHEKHNPPLNKRNPIGPKNPNRSAYLEAAKRLLLRRK